MILLTSRVRNGSKLSLALETTTSRKARCTRMDIQALAIR